MFKKWQLLVILNKLKKVEVPKEKIATAIIQYNFLIRSPDLTRTQI